MNSSWSEELDLWKEFKISHVEVWASKVDAFLATGGTYEQMRRQLGEAGVTVVGLAFASLSTSNDPEQTQREMDALGKRLEMAVALGAPALAVIILGEVQEDIAKDYACVAEKLRKASEMAASRDIRLCLEFLGGYGINGTLGSCIELINQVDHPACGLLFDLCHYYTSASHLEELTLLPSEKLFMVHIDDSSRLPMERLSSERRCFPGEGRIDVPNMMRALHRFGYRGYYSVELYDRGIWKMDASEVMSRLSCSLKELEKQLGEITCL